jgi:release factor glutamine methyltransferase
VSIHARVAAARQRLRDAGIPNAESDLDARLLAQHVLGWTTERYLADAQSNEPDGFVQSYESLIARRASREPLAYIVGVREFWGLDFEVSPAVLIPRPSTELIVEAALRQFPDRDATLRIADACTGCGCLAVALAHERPRSSVIATDISPEALDVARRNVRRHAVDRNVELRHTDLLEGIGNGFDLVVANPPYVLDGAAPALQPEVRDHEPAVALFGGVDGLTLVNRLVASAADCLVPGGWLMFEFGLGQDVEIEELLGSARELRLEDVRRDLDGIARTAVARRV